MNWEKVKLGDVATFVNGYAFKPTDWATEGLEIIRIQNLTKGASETNYYQGVIPEKYKVVNGDILISWSATLDVFVWKGKDAWLNQHIFKVVFDKLEIDKRFFIYLIMHVLDDMRRQVHGATMQHITKDKFDSLQIPLPPLDEQKRIAEILDKADALRRKDKELLKKYDELAQAIFIDMFGDPVRNEKGWEVKKLGEVCKLQGGYSFKSSEILKNGVRLVKIGNVHFEKMDWSETEYLPFDFLSKYSSFALKENDICIALTRPIIKSLNSVKVVMVSKSDLPCLLNQRVGRFILNENKINRTYLINFIYSRFFKEKIEKLSSTSLQPNVGTGQIEEIEIPIPSIVHQLQFEQCINTTLRIKSLNSFINSNNLFNSLLQKAFKEEL